MSKLLDTLLGYCAHDRYTFPLTLRPSQRRSGAATLTGTYVVCLDCGKEFPYSWADMKVILRTPVPAAGSGSRAVSDLAVLS